MKYAIQIKLAEDDWIYVTKDTGGHCWDLQPELFDTLESAEKFADIWRIKGREDNVIVVEYKT